MNIQELKKLIKGCVVEVMRELDENGGASVTGNVAGVQTPFWGTHNKKGNERAATVSMPGSKIVAEIDKDKKTEKIVKQINEDIDYNVKKDYDAFVAANVKTKTDLETKLSKSLVGKNVVVRGKKNVKTGIYIKNYEIEVQSVNIDGTDIVLVDKKNDKYFVDKNYTIKIIDSTKQTPAQQPPTQSTSGQPDLSKEISK